MHPAKCSAQVLSTIADVASALRVSERTLRDVIADLGYSRPPGRKKYLFNAAMVKAIREAIQCRLTTPQEPDEETDPLLCAAGLVVASTKSERARQTRRLLKTLGIGGSAESANVMSPHVERHRHSTKRFDYTKPTGI